MNGGIYGIRCPDGGLYIGGTTDFVARFAQHKSAGLSGRHHNRNLRAAIAKHGFERMRFDRIMLCAPEDLLVNEQLAIDAFKPEYNIARIAGNNTGVRHSEEAKRKIGDAARHKLSPDHCAKISAGRKGMKFSDEHRANISKATKGKPKRQPKGKKGRSAEVNALVGAKLRGRKMSPDAIANMVAAQRKRRERDAVCPDASLHDSVA